MINKTTSRIKDDDNDRCADGGMFNVYCCKLVRRGVFRLIAQPERSLQTRDTTQTARLTAVNNMQWLK